MRRLTIVNKIGLDVALEALRDCRTRSMDDLWHYAGIRRVRNVMRPYVEALQLSASIARGSGT